MSDDWRARVRDAIVALDEPGAVQATQAAIAAGVAPRLLLEDALTEGMLEVGRRWNGGTMFLPQVMVAARIFARCSALVEPALLADGDRAPQGPRLLLATVKGDIHDLGKTIVGSMLKTRGFEVVDLGKDVSCARLADAVRELRPRLLGLSAMLTSTMGQQGEAIAALERAGLRQQVRVIVGGAPVNARWAEQIGADGYAANAAEAISLVEELLSA